MDNFKIIYRILRILEKAMDLEDFDKSCISKERLELTEARWNRIIAMLVAEGYVTGIETWDGLDFGYPRAWTKTKHFFGQSELIFSCRCVIKKMQ